MAVRKKKLRSLSGRVIKIRDQQHFNRLRSDARLCIVAYVAALRENTPALRKALKDYSAKREFSHVLFAEVDIEGSAAEAIVREQSIEGPLLQAWRNGQLLEARQGTPWFVRELTSQHAGPPPSNDSRWAKLAQKAAIAVAVAGVGVLAVLAARRFLGRLEEEGDEGGMSRLENDLLFINEHIQAIEAELAEEVEIDRLRKAEEKREEDEGIMRMPPMPGSEPLEKDKRDPGSTWFNEQQQALRSLRRREQALSARLDALEVED